MITEVAVSQQVWAGVDAGKSDHHCVAIDAEGQRLLSQRVANDETALLELIDAVAAQSDGGEVTWAIDLNAGGAALLITLLIAAEQRLLYIPGRTIYHASAGYRGDGKSDAKDAAVIADQARMRRDLQPLRPGDDIAVELRILTARRTDLVADRTRVINRLRAQLLEYFPALERGFDYSASKAALILLTGYQTPDGLRRAGAARLTAWLHKRKARNASAVAATAIEAASAQHTTVPGQNLAAAMVARLAKEVMTLDTEIAETDTMIEDRFRRHRHAEILLSMPGFGVILGAEFLAATGGDMSAFDSVDRLAGVSGLAPVPRDSGRISGNLKRPRRYDRRLLRACYLSAQIAIRTDPASRTYYNRKRAEGKTHTQSILALARRRLNVLWAMLRDHAVYQPATTTAAA
ncbi:IS110 family transposase [Mycobacterium gordonae]|jgi:transposase|uniref:Transposase n=7 Tax=Mycobacterium TaxID=1763 RepID=A0A7U5RVG8_MYCIT|nr:transposase [Mycobacterium intracellulare subsp. chimaera]KLO25340.1 transposase [Mycobacterium nebraskense]ODR22542.1 IS110 family transposase [Mycobacterium gordonae]ORA42270.1 IS110 family transposase [Mycobacterium bouchedurhonense]ORB63289.1 IS110 family transposase [Mycobacterium scrofulaceum]TXA40696.1 IS110 family transposase [Mycobacterium tuberculosis variant bovis]CQD11240.1 transposase [Mycobacterium europaeum]GJO03089.1 IS110 family transposase [Mycobacterium marinum]